MMYDCTWNKLIQISYYLKILLIINVTEPTGTIKLIDEETKGRTATTNTTVSLESSTKPCL